MLNLNIPEFEVLSPNDILYYLSGVIENHIKIVYRQEPNKNRIKVFLTDLNLNTFCLIQKIFGGYISKNESMIEIKNSDFYTLSQKLKELNTPKASLYRLFIEYYEFNQQFCSGAIPSDKEKIEKIEKINGLLAANSISTEICEINNYYLIGELDSMQDFYLKWIKGEIHIVKSGKKSPNINCDEIGKYINSLIVNKDFYSKLLELNTVKCLGREFNNIINNYRDLLETNRNKLIFARDKNVLDSEYLKQRERKKLERKEKFELDKKIRIEERQLIKETIKSAKIKRNEEDKILKLKKKWEDKKEKLKVIEFKKIEKENFHNSLFSQGLLFCKKCNQSLSIDNFNKQSNGRFGYKPYCKKCSYNLYVTPNKEQYRIRSLKWQKDNPEKVKVIRKTQRVKPANKLKHNIKSRIKSYFTERKNVMLYKSIINCAPKFLYDYMESKFEPGMTWENYGSYWSIDHIIPCVAFDWTIKQHLLWCWDYKNLRPLIATENSIKQDYLPNGLTAREMKRDNPEGFKLIIANMLEELKITTKEEYFKSFNSTEVINLFEIH